MDYSCVTSVSYSLQLNGQKVGSIKPSRGLRQGDPLSPFLFLICMEGLSHKLKSSSLQGIAISHWGLFISHLLFANDFIIFTRGSLREAEMLKRILQCYSKASHQTINLHKSSIIFSRNTPETIRSDISQILQIKELEGLNKYLGLPTIFPRSKKQVFHNIKERIQGKILGWKEQCCLRGARRLSLKLWQLLSQFML